MTTLLTHGVGLSTGAMTPSSLSRVRFRLEFFFQFFGYSPSWSNFGSHVFIHFYMCTTPGKQPSWLSNIFFTFLPVFLHLVSKRFLPPHLSRWCPQAGHCPRTNGWFRCGGNSSSVVKLYLLLWQISIHLLRVYFRSCNKRLQAAHTHAPA